ncbi:DHH family phosphoesterase [Candidatus Uhrbacteria bacterium]|nr:DHH family phosphoesterase [Candidatus Uhrbacteria bacterium]
MELLFTEAWGKIMAASRILIVPDKRVDGDSLGSSLALADILIQEGKQVVVLVSELVPPLYQFLPHLSLCTQDVSKAKALNPDLIISFDCSDAPYIESLRPSFPPGVLLINVDHHATNSRYGDLNLVDEKAPATAELLYRLLNYVRQKISPPAALCLLAGIGFDTSLLRNSNTNEASFRMIADLVRLGGRLPVIQQALTKSHSVASLRLWGLAFDRLHEHKPFGFISTFITRADLALADVDEEEVGGLSNFLKFVLNIDTLLVLRENQAGGVSCSMRSSHRDVSLIARAFGGGGHTRAAGFTVEKAKIHQLPDGSHRIERF